VHFGVVVKMRKKRSKKRRMGWRRKVKGGVRRVCGFLGRGRKRRRWKTKEKEWTVNNHPSGKKMKRGEAKGAKQTPKWW